MVTRRRLVGKPPAVKQATPGASGVSGTLLSPNAAALKNSPSTRPTPAAPASTPSSSDRRQNALLRHTRHQRRRVVPVGTSSGALMFDYNQPCKRTESVDLPINTTTVTDGQHTLKVTVEDAAQNRASSTTARSRPRTRPPTPPRRRSSHRARCSPARPSPPIPAHGRRPPEPGASPTATSGGLRRPGQQLHRHRWGTERELHPGAQRRRRHATRCRECHRQ